MMLNQVMDPSLDPPLAGTKYIRKSSDGASQQYQLSSIDLDYFKLCGIILLLSAE